MGKLLAPSISKAPHLAAFDSMSADRFQDINLSPMLVYMIDTVPAVALNDLLDQFDLMGYKGARFITTDQEKRDLIKKGIELKRYAGTAWSIKEALKLIGVTDVEFFNVPYDFYYDGVFNYDGSQGYGQTSWATFIIKINAATFPTITSQILEDIIGLVNQYKPQTRKLLGVVGFGLLYNGVATYDGSYNYDAVFYPVP